jgi:CO/xanthine dehydrogenase Mo-binding subunit
MARIALDGVEVHTAAIEVGQGMNVALAQIARTALGMDRVEVVFDHTGLIGSAGSSSASRQTQVSGGAVLQACRELRRAVLERFDGDRLDDAGVWRGPDLVADFARIADEPGLAVFTRFTAPATERPGVDGQGAIHSELAVAACRAVVDVDPELGLVRVASLEIAQDVGRVVNPLGLVGQVEGGAAMGLGLAVMEGLVVRDGRILNASFTDYLIPTTLDMPAVRTTYVEDPSTWGPFGAKGVGEPPTVVAGPAIAAAIRAATGRPISRFPIPPGDVIVPEGP